MTPPSTSRRCAASTASHSGFYEALEKLEQLEQMVLFLAKKADSFRPGALGKEGKKRDPHFGQKMVSWRANVHSFDPASAVDVPSDH